MTEALNPIEWKNDALVLLDQTKLPNDIVYEEFTTVESVWDAIVTMKVRGAPAIGVAAAYGVYLAVRNSETDLVKVVQKSAEYLATSRPTAVNLFWALDRMTAVKAPDAIYKEALLAEAKAIHKEDEEINRTIGENLLTLLTDGMGILTHCNAGALATSKYGTATAPMYLAKEKGWDFKVYADETRPRLQGSTLTALELSRAGIDVTVITDNMAAMVMSQGKVQAVIVGCDRVAANGDTANKIGTLGVSILAKHYNIPFYVAAPTPTIDLNTPTGTQIPIEERHKSEVIEGFGRLTAPADVNVYNPAFDVTPHEHITAIVTEKGIVRAPYEENLKKLFR
ncbi:S-methyl-5-thioribose-1-phosphate isomerase [Paenisporosarcina sp. FSL H8-0542]|uniref:S-methyl-5-thioribose-1-phosphate isomerase n=1 Tax=unclassified Paenisporosarcina TaxID=2642018 RepID=UPI00034EA877|nr:S-methyl-5-thioribose-1-phosphate isomerase [Paenisporosarcina sp. HGH0030]EPD51917.1 methylthioribose-1-phosphate isomerase 1 [Paenisporosarcina sp. HGH0030]